MAIIENRIELLEEMMADLAVAPEQYKPGNYWRVYETQIYEDLKKLDLNQLRHGVLPSGTVRSFGGGGDVMRFRHHRFFPWDPQFKSWENKTLVRLVDKLVSLAAKAYPPLLSLSLTRVQQGKEYFDKLLEIRRRQAYAVASILDHRGKLATIQDSEAANPECITIEGRRYSLQFLNKFAEYCYIARFVDFDNVRFVLELGPGIGMQAAVLGKAEPHVKMCLIDIPPQLYVSQQYLQALFPGEVLTYRKTRDLPIIDAAVFKDCRIVCLGTWDLEKVRLVPDLLISEYSFQEIDKPLVDNYLDQVKRLSVKYIYLNNLTEGHFRATKVGERGVLQPATCDHMCTYLQSHYKLVDRRPTLIAEGLQEGHEQMMFQIR